MSKNIIIAITCLMATIDIQRQFLLYIPLEQEVPFPPIVLCSDILFPLFSSFLSLETSAVSWPRQENDVDCRLTDSGVLIPTLSWFNLLLTAFNGHRFISRQDSNCLVGLQALPVFVCCRMVFCSCCVSFYFNK